MKLGVCQMLVSLNKQKNINKSRDLIKELKRKGANIVVLPECFNSEYSTTAFPKNAELLPDVDQGAIRSSTFLNDKSRSNSNKSKDGIDESNKRNEIAKPIKKNLQDVDVTNYTSETSKYLSDLAKELNIYIVGGSIPEYETRTGEYFNTSLVFNPQGSVIAKHRKMHLFDIDIPNGIKFQESETLSGGNQFTYFDTSFGVRIGVGICYDMRFPEYAMILRQHFHCDFIIYPGAFNMTTGPLHWELLQRARALDNQLYVAAVSPARDMSASYKAYGFSSVVNPWGEVIAKADEKEHIFVVDIDLTALKKVREGIPISKQKRFDIYSSAILKKCV